MVDGIVSMKLLKRRAQFICVMIWFGASVSMPSIVSFIKNSGCVQRFKCTDS